MVEDWIKVREIRVFGYHGVTDQEQVNGQVFEVDVALGVDMSRASLTDNLADTVDYTQISLRVERIVGGKPCHLLEAVASRVADDLFSAYPQVDQVTVRLRKPNVARALRLGAVEIELKRSRDTGRTCH